MQNYQIIFLSDSNGKSLENLWQSFTCTLEKYVNECIPTKLIKKKASLPWLTQDIKRLIRKPDKLYVLFKKTGHVEKKKSFQSLHQQIKCKIKDSYHTYLESFLGLGMARFVILKSFFPS